MPVILDTTDYDTWLTADDQAIIQQLLQPFPAQLMAAYPISNKVNSVKNDTPDVMEPISSGTQPTLDLF
jgi:putative SOS response-associated peptidase YedK